MMAPAALVVMTDGRRDCIVKSIPSLMENLHGNFTTKLIHDDSGDPEYVEFLWELFGPHGFIVHATGQRSGFAGAYRSAWAWLREHDRNDWILSTEDDFVITRAIEVADMQAVMARRADIAQMALLRQAWSAAEIRAGGVIEAHPKDYVRESIGVHRFMTHRRFFTTNTSLFRRSLIMANDWPKGSSSEGHFSLKLFAEHPKWKSGYWGHGAEMIEHFGTQRVGNGY